MAAISIRDLDDSVRQKLRIRAAQHGTSMESEIRSILTAAVDDGSTSQGLAQAILTEFGSAGGVELTLPSRSERPRAPSIR